jgi:hypothetical protein
MTCRYAHRRIVTLFTMVQITPAARVIDWPTKVHGAIAQRGRTGISGKSSREAVYANK